MAGSLLDEVTRRACASLKPPPRIDLATWIEANVHLPEGMSDQHGLVRLWPYQHGICDAISDPAIERVTVVKSARLGYTTLLTGMIASYVANDPCQILVVLPTDDDCRDYMVSEIEPVFAASPALRGRLTDDGASAGTKSRNTITGRRFVGGSFKLIGGQSPRNMRRHNAQVLVIDEAAALEDDVKAGSVVSRAITRTKGFSNRKIIMGSTPIDDTSNVLLSYAVSDRRRFEVPCPGCGTYTFLEWRHIEWEKDRPETAAFRCPHCGDLFAERHKPAMVAAGRWIAQNPEVRDHAGFLINALVSPLPNASWGKLATEFLLAKDDPALLRPFVNETLAEPWRGDAVDVDEAALAKAAEPFGLAATTEAGAARPIPPEVLAVTVGTDVQDDRLECTVVGWSASQLFVLAHRVIWGSPADEETWSQHDDLVLSTWRHPHGGTLKVDACVVDSGDGDWTQQVYDYCFPRARRRVLAGKGVGGNRPVIQASQGMVKGGRLYIVGVDGIKSTVMARLGQARSVRFSDTLEPAYYDQLVSEQRVLRRARGQVRRVWERKPGARAEALDCLVYAYAARHAVQINFDSRAAAMTGDEPAAPAVGRSPREQAEINRRAGMPTGPAPAGAPLRPRSPREQAEFYKHGTIGGVRPAPPAPRATPAATATPEPARAQDNLAPKRSAPRPTSWGELLKKA